jgi:hypothetical protein
VRVVAAVGAVLVALVVALAAAAWLGGDDDGTEASAVRLAGDGSGVRGVAHFEQEGARTTGFVVVWGLEPGSEHAVHFHGPDSACGTDADPVAAHPDLRADADGVAYTDVDVTADQPLLGGGFYYNVHQGPSTEAENPEIACGDITADGAAITGS